MRYEEGWTELKQGGVDRIGERESRTGSRRGRIVIEERERPGEGEAEYQNMAYVTV